MEIKDIAVLERKIPAITNEADALVLYMAAELVNQQAKAFFKEAKEAISVYMKETGLCEIEITDTAKLVYSKKSDYEIDVEGAKKSLGFTDEQMAVLSSSDKIFKTKMMQSLVTTNPFIKKVQKDHFELSVMDEKFMK